MTLRDGRSGCSSSCGDAALIGRAVRFISIVVVACSGLGGQVAITSAFAAARSTRTSTVLAYCASISSRTASVTRTTTTTTTTTRTLIHRGGGKSTVIRQASSATSCTNSNKDENRHLIDNDYDVVIVGGGIVGLATGVGLCCDMSNNSSSSSSIPNLKVLILERASSLRPIGALLGFFPNGVTALQSISSAVATNVLASCIPYRGLHLMNMTHTDDNDNDKNSLSSSSRYQEKLDTTGSGRFLVWYLLQQHLAEAFSPAGGTLRLNQVFESYRVDPDTGWVTVCYSDRTTGKQTHCTCRVLIGADGIHSAVRRQMEQQQQQQVAPVPTTKLHYHNRIMYRALLNLDELEEHIRPPPGIAVSYRCGELGKVFAYRETAKGIVTFTATVMSDDEPKHMLPSHHDDDNHHDTTSSSSSLQRLLRAFATYPAAVQQILDRVDPAAIYENAVYDVDVMDEWSTAAGGAVVVIGDAAHAMSPVLGQGANIGLEDACELSRALTANSALFSTASSSSWATRRNDTTTDDNDDGSSSETDTKETMNTMTTTATTASTATISQVLQDFWKHRIDRVKEVHRVSREQTVYKNTQKVTPGNTVGSFRERNPDFYKRLYGWTPRPMSEWRLKR